MKIPQVLFHAVSSRNMKVFACSTWLLIMNSFLVAVLSKANVFLLIGITQGKTSWYWWRQLVHQILMYWIVFGVDMSTCMKVYIYIYLYILYNRDACVHPSMYMLGRFRIFMSGVEWNGVHRSITMVDE